MAKKQRRNFRINAGQAPGPPKIDASRISVDSAKIGVSLRYFQSSFECFSKWQKSELKDFSALLLKLSARNEAQVMAQFGHAHKGKPKALPKQISPDVKMCSLTVTKKARMHGFFSGDAFYLVWLDREHRVLAV